jgi:hypothetical protein
MSIAAIHQPNFLPWIGFFYKIKQSDVFIFLDDAQFSKGSFTNRNKIKTPNGEKYITMPMMKKRSHFQMINECEIRDKNQSVEKILNSLRSNYRKSKYFDDYFEPLKDIINSDTSCLSDINISLVEWVLDILEIRTRTERSSNLENIDGVSTDRLVSICKAVDANKYLSGFGGSNYQDESKFLDHDIELLTTDFKHPVYDQLWGDFLPCMSVIDLIFNCGKDSKNLI